ncbi:MAG: extracellular solute-binding protein [Candidatus Caccosoma sp.]|nr:extracellular solute-binding protein [Candidatus Caccosoma sp.]
MYNKQTIKNVTIALAVAICTTICAIPYFKTLAKSNKIQLVVDLHGYMPSINRTPTAEDPDVFNSTYYIAKNFMEENPDIEIVWARTKPVGGMDSEVAQWFTTQIAGETVPAIAFSWGSRYQDRDWYLSLDKYLDEPNSSPLNNGNTWRSIFRDYLWNSNSIIDANNNTVAIPITVYPGASTGYFYNKTAFNKANITSTPKTWKEFITCTEKLEEVGYVGVAPWLYFNTTTTFDAWVFQSVMSPSYSQVIFDQLDYDKDGRVSAKEQARACLEGKFSPFGENKELAIEMYDNLYYYYKNMLKKGWASIDYSSQWTNGDVGIREEGLWAIPTENSNTVREFDYGVFVAPLVSNDSSSLLGEVEYSTGPYQPSPDLSLNIMKAAVKDNPKMLDAALRFLKDLSKPQNVSLICVENGGVLGAVKGTNHSNIIDEFIKGQFPKTKDCSWPAGFCDEQGDKLNRRFEEWVNGVISKDEFLKEVDIIQATGAKTFLTNMNIDYSSWNIKI